MTGTVIVTCKHNLISAYSLGQTLRRIDVTEINYTQCIKTNTKIMCMS